MLDRLEFPEGSTPISDCSGLIPIWVHNLKDLNRVEAENIIEAQRKYFHRRSDDPKKWFYVELLKTIHSDMFGAVWEWAGSYRKTVTSIGIKPSMIPGKLAEFCMEVRSWLEHPVELTFIDMAARIHHRLVYIHPFENGNGRFSRLIADRFLLAFRCSYPMWPNLNQEGLERKDYIQTLKSADRGDYVPLVIFMKKLGAKDPTLGELLQNNFYRSHVKADKGLALVNAMLKNGGNPNDESSKGHRILQLAIKSGLNQLAKLLVNAGAAIEIKDRSGLSPLQAAKMKNNTAIIDFLMSKGAQQ
jgi:Fic-DOC domain mobile mystery protein B